MAAAETSRDEVRRIKRLGNPHRYSVCPPWSKRRDNVRLYHQSMTTSDPGSVMYQNPWDHATESSFKSQSISNCDSVIIVAKRVLISL